MSSYKFRVLLDSSAKEDIFRDIQIANTATYEDFYKAILNAFSFGGNQMASFYLSNDDWDKGFEITYMDMGNNDELDEPTAIMSSHKLADFVSKKKQKLILVHDFMRMWIFLIELVEISDATVEQPTVVLSVGNAPAEDSKEIDKNFQFGDDDLDFDDETYGDDDFNDDDFDMDDLNDFDDFDDN